MKKLSITIAALLFAALAVVPSLAAAATAPLAPIPVKLTLKVIGVSSGVLPLGNTVAATGTVTPASLVNEKATLTVQREVGGKWLAVTSQASTLSTSGTYSGTFRPATQGTYRLKTAIAATATHTAATTMWQTVQVNLTAAQALVVRLINIERARYHLAAVQAQVNLMNAAGAHSAQMAADAYFSHSSRNGETFATRIINAGYTRTGYRLWKTGENIYYGSGALASSPLAAVSGWMQSPGHRAIILTSNFRDVGIGIATSAAGLDGIPNVTFFTLDFGVRIR